MIYLKVDQVMLNEMVGNNAVGNYAAATKISEAWYFIPMAIVSSVTPSLIAARRVSKEQFDAKLSKLFGFVTLGAFAVALPAAAFSDQIMTLIYGTSYVRAGPVLAIHIWAAVFVFLGCAQTPFWLAENLQKFTICLTSMGAAVNVVLNMVLIPRYQEIGAAAATLISYAFPSLFALALFDKTKPLFHLTVRALLNPFRAIMK